MAYGQEKNTYNEQYSLGKFEELINIIHHPKIHGKIPPTTTLLKYNLNVHTM